MATFAITTAVNSDTLSKLGSVASLAWTRSGTNATVTQNSHGMVVGDLFSVTVTSDVAAITVGVKTLTAVTLNTFTFVCLASGGPGTLTGHAYDNYNINGGYLTVDQNTRWGLNQTTFSFMYNIVGSASLGGTIEFNSTLVRAIPFDSVSAGNVPAYNTTITGGTSSATGKLIAVVSSLTAAPTAPGAACPASGWLVVKSWNSTAFQNNETLSALATGALVNGTDRAGWLEIVGAEAGTATINRLSTFKVRGAWWDFQGVTTDGTRTTTYQIPTLGSAANYHAGVWVQRVADKTVTAASWAASYATYTASAHGLVAGEYVTVSGVTPTGYNVEDVKITSVTTNTFTIPLTVDPGSWSSGGAAYSFEFYPCAGSRANAAATTAVDATRGKVCWITASTGLLRFGSDGTTTTGAYIPPSGLRIRLPNIFFVNCVPLTTPATNVLPNATPGTRMEFATTGAGVIDIEKASVSWYCNFVQPYSVTLSHVGILTLLLVQEIASAIAWAHVGVGHEAANTQVALSMTLCLSGGTMAYCTWMRASAIATSAVTMTDVTGLTITYEKTFNLLLRTGLATTYVLTRVSSSTWTNTRIGNGYVAFNTCNDLSWTTTIYYDNPATTTGTANALSLFNFLLSCVRITIDGLTFDDLTLCQPYTGIVNLGLAGNSAIKLRNLGTYASPLNMGGAMVDGTFTQATTVVTVTKVAHGLKTGDSVYVYSLTAGGTFAVGLWALASAPTADTFTITRTSGTAGSPLPVQYYPVMTGQLVNIVAAHNGNNIQIKRCYVPGLRTNLIVQGDNSNKNVVLESVVGAFPNAPTSISQEQYNKQLSCTHPLAAQTSVYGTHFLDQFTTGIPTSVAGVSWTRSSTTATVTSAAHGLRTGDLINVTVTSDASAIVLGQKSITVTTSSAFTFTCLASGGPGTLTFVALTGRIAIQANEKTTVTADAYSEDSGSNFFTSAGTCYMPTVGNQITFTSPSKFIGHTGFPIAEAVMQTGTITNHDITYSMDDGATYSNLSLSRFVTPLTATAAATTYPYIVKMSSTQSLAIWVASTTFLQACVITVDSGLVTMGSPFTLNAAATTYPTVTRMTDTVAVVSWVAGATIQSLTLTLSGLNIISGITVLTDTGASTYLSIVRMTDSQAMLAYSNAATFSYLHAVILDLTGSGAAATFTVGMIKVVNATATTYIALAAISTTQAVVAMRDISTFCKTYVLDVAASVITNGALSAASGAAAVSYISITALSSTKVIIAYIGVTSYAEAVVGTVTGTDCAFGTVKPLNATTSTFVAITTLSSTEAMATFRTNDTFLSAIHLTEAAAVITIGSLKTVNTVAVGSNYSVAGLSSSLAISIYIGASSFVQMRLLNVSGTTITCIADSIAAGTTIDLANGGGSQVAVNDYVFGTGIAPNARVQSISGESITLTIAHTALVTGFVRFNQIPNATVADSSIGFPLRLRFTTKLPNFTAFASLYFFTSSTATSRGYTYPLDPVTVRVTCLDASTGDPVVGARAYLLATGGGLYADGTVVLNAISDADGIAEDTAFAYLGTQSVIGKARKGTASPYYKSTTVAGTVTADGLDVTVYMVADE